jgi:hypothetical protein
VRSESSSVIKDLFAHKTSNHRPLHEAFQFARTDDER